MKAKRQNASIMALLMFFFSVFPVKRSEAFAPPLIYAAYMTASTGAGTYTIAALAGAIGVSGLYITIQDAMDNQVRIPIGPNPNNQPTPPVAPATATGTQGYPSYYASGWDYAATPQGVCSNCNWACQGPNCTPPSCSYIPGGAYGSCSVSWGSYGSRVDNIYGVGSSVLTCPSGYTQNGGACVLSNPRRATDDKTCDLLYSQGAFATADDMNCGSSVDGSKVAPMIRDGNVIAYGRNSSGQPLMWEVKPGPQTWTVKEYEQVQTATQTQVKQTTVTIDSATSEVMSVQTQTSVGSISSPGSSSVPSVTDPATQPTSSTNTPTTTTSADGIVFPSDYARTGEAQRAADSITDLMKPTSEVADPTLPEWADNWGSTFNPLKAWSVPGHSSVCPVGSFNWNGSTYTIDSHCRFISDYWSALQSAAVVFWTVLALFILLGA